MRSGGMAKRRDAEHRTLLDEYDSWKKFLALDPKNSTGLADMRRMPSTGHVFIHNTGGDALARLELGYDDVKFIKHDIV